MDKWSKILLNQELGAQILQLVHSCSEQCFGLTGFKTLFDTLVYPCSEFCSSGCLAHAVSQVAFFFLYKKILEQNNILFNLLRSPMSNHRPFK